MTQNRESTRYFSQRQEERVAKILGLKVVPNSGARIFNKGDVRGQECLVECKTMVEPRKSISIKKEWLTKIRQEAFDSGKSMGMLVFDFGDGDDYVVLRLKDFKDLF